MDLGASLTRKIGPLPVWAYGAIVIAAAWGYYYVTGGRATQASGDSGVPVPDASDADFVDESGTTLGSGTGGSNAGTGTTSPGTNQEWFSLASQYLLGFGYEGVAVTNALTKYLTGEALSIPERALMNMAVSRWGAPPEGVPVTTGAPPTTPTLPEMPGGIPRPGERFPRRPMPWPSGPIIGPPRVIIGRRTTGV